MLSTTSTSTDWQSDVVRVVKEELPRALTDNEEARILFENAYVELLQSKDINPNNLTNVFNGDLQVVDHLCKCRILPVGCDTFEYNMRMLHQPDLNMFFVRSQAPNAFIFIDDESPTALFTKHGHLTLAGGHDESTIGNCMLHFCLRVIHVLRIFYPDKCFLPQAFTIHNKVATNRIRLNKICISSMIDGLRRRNFTSVQHSPEKINFTFVKELLPFRRSITFCISASGGVNILGFKYNYEARCAALLLSFILLESNSLFEYLPQTPENLEKENLIYTQKKQNELIKKKQKKIKRLIKWKNAAEAETERIRQKVLAKQLKKDAAMQAAATKALSRACLDLWVQKDICLDVPPPPLEEMQAVTYMQ